MDALRVKDNTRVFLKRIPKDSDEVEITSLFSSEEKIGDPCNHCVPVLDYFEDERLPECGILVTPLLRPFDEPAFVSIDEVVEFVRQTLEVRLLLVTSVLGIPGLKDWVGPGLHA